MNEDIRVAVVVLGTLPLGVLANTVAALSIGIGAGVPSLGGERLTDREGRTIEISSNRPVPVLQAGEEAIKALLLKALADPARGTVVAFPAFARTLHHYGDYAAVFPEKNLAEEAIDGIGLAGPDKWVRSLTGSLKLLR